VTGTVRIAALYHYPVKSARGIELERALLTSAGFADDRRWMAVSSAGRFLTQRELPRLALIQPRLSPTELLLSAPGMPQIAIQLPGALERRCVTIWNDSCDAFDEGDDIAHWLQGLLRRDCRLVRFDPAHRRLSSRAFTGEIEAENRFTDAFPVMLIGNASLADLNARLPQALPMNRFRPNIALEGAQPYDEDRMDELRTAGICLKLVKPCTRCCITATDQDSGQLEGDQPLQALHSYRYDSALRGVCFGQNAVIVEGAGAALMRGQTLEVRWKRAAAE
jgi:uncharacterized protein YcbX